MIDDAGIHASGESRPGSALVPNRGLPGVRAVGVIALVLLCISCALSVAVVFLGGLARDYNNERLGYEIVWWFGPWYGPVLVWAILVGLALCLAVRLAAPPGRTLPGRWWPWPFIAGVALVVVAHLHYWDWIAGEASDQVTWVAGLWLGGCALTVALFVQAIALTATRKWALSHAGVVRIFVSTAVVETILFIVVNYGFTMWLLFCIAYATSEHD